ncbi:MAG: TnsA endonuclease N-terminal domain-containing protein [Methylobacter sp.]
MAKRNYSSSEIKVQKWLKEGRGSGRGRDYKPWLTVRDVPSDGRSHRIFGHKSQRIHHFLSDLELAVFFVLEWHQDTKDIREQFPLRTEDTLALANDLGISHPSYRGVPQIMTSDFLVNTINAQRPKFVLQAKYSEALQDARTIEKLELERRYWQQKSVPWLLITEEDIPNIVFQNISWLYPAQREELDGETIQERVAMYAHHFDRAPFKSLIDIAKELDVAYSLPAGQSLLEIRQLLARRCFLFDIFTPYTALKARDLCAENMNTYTEALRVSNQ